MIHTEGAEDGGEPRANVDYFRRLHQQIVQKDNIIKLLQMQLKKVDDDDRGGHGEGASGVDPETVDRLTTALGEAEARLAEYEAREDDADASDRDQRALEGELEELRGRVREASRFEAELSLKQEELERHRELLRGADGDQRELERLRGETERQDLRIQRLERELGEAREAGARGGAEAGPGEIEDLRNQVADLEAALDVARETVEALRSRDGGEVQLEPDTFRLVQEVVEGLQVFEDLEHEVYTPEDALEAVEACLHRLRDMLALERIRTVGAPFDSLVHVVGRTVYTEEAEHGSILAEEVPGYLVDGRPLKLAQVTVARNPFVCEKCHVLAVSGAAFCHGCGARIPKRKAESPDGTPAARPRDEARRLLEVASSRRARGDREGARETLEKALEMAPEDPRVLFEAAMGHEEEGRFAEAHQIMARLPSSVPGLRDLERHRSRLAEKAEILEHLRKVR